MSERSATAHLNLAINGTFDDWSYRVLSAAAERDGVSVSEAFSRIIMRHPEALERLCRDVIVRESIALGIPLLLSDLKAS